MQPQESSYQEESYFKDQQPLQAAGSHPVETHGFTQAFGLHPGVAVAVFIINAMIFAADWGTLGAFWPVSLLIGVVLGVITYRAQVKWYGDDNESALIKAALLALLTAIPVPIPAALSVPAGIVGLFRRK